MKGDGSKIVELKEVKGSPVVEAVVHQTGSLHRQAVFGEAIGLIGATIDADGGTSWFFAGRLPPLRTLGALEHLKQEFYKDVF